MLPAVLSDNKEAHAAGTDESVLFRDAGLAVRDAFGRMGTQLEVTDLKTHDDSNIGGIRPACEIVAAWLVIVAAWLVIVLELS
jgi:hypothetical protein